MDRINHVKIITPDPEAVDLFLRARSSTGKDGIRAFFAEVGAIVFEVLRVESKA
jgi:hypothetical protein